MQLEKYFLDYDLTNAKKNYDGIENDIHKYLNYFLDYDIFAIPATAVFGNMFYHRRHNKFAIPPIYNNMFYHRRHNKFVIPLIYNDMFYYGRYNDMEYNHTEIYIKLLCRYSYTRVNYIRMMCNHIYNNIILSYVHSENVTRFDVHKDGKIIAGLNGNNNLVFRE